jgi:hypothetical protein
MYGNEATGERRTIFLLKIQCRAICKYKVAFGHVEGWTKESLHIGIPGTETVVVL